MKKILFLLLALSLFSCNRQTEFEKKLIEGKWVYYRYEKLSSNARPVAYLRFYEDGSCKNYYINSDSELIKLHKSQSPQLWKYFSEKKKLVVMGHEFEVLSVEGDTIRLLNKENNSKEMLYNIGKIKTKLKKLSEN